MSNIDKQIISRVAREMSLLREEREVECEVCGKTFTARDSRATYCSNRCRQAAKYQRQKEKQQTKNA